MKTQFNRITAIILALLICSLVFTACDGTGKHLKLTEQMIRRELTDSDGKGTLTIDSGSAENVTAFTYVFDTEFTSSLRSKENVKSAVKKLSSGKSSTLFEFSMFDAFCETMIIVGLFYNTENFDSGAYIEELLSILCDGRKKTYNGWTISATINETANNVTIKCYT